MPPRRLPAATWWNSGRKLSGSSRVNSLLNQQRSRQRRCRSSSLNSVRACRVVWLFTSTSMPLLKSSSA